MPDEVRIAWDDHTVALLADPTRTPGVARAIDRVAAQLVVAVKREAPVSPVTSGHSGRLRSSVHAFRQPDGSVIIGPTAPYSRFVIDGTRPHIIRSHGDWPLRNRATGAVFGSVVHHPGTRPNNFVLRALERVRGMAL